MVSRSTLAHARVASTCEAVASPLALILEELRTVVGSLDVAAYSSPMGSTFAHASVGGHVRHCLDHARALVDGRAAGVIDYDHRARGTRIESDPGAALDELDRLISGIVGLSEVEAEEPVGVAIMPTRDGDTTVLGSTLARELAFVLSHTIHHNATIRGMAVAMGKGVPASFGYAPSTLAYGDRRACAR